MATAAHIASAYFPGSDERALFQPEHPVFSIMEGCVSGDGDTDVRHELTVQILTQIRDNLALINKKQDAFGSDLHTVSERVVRLEERNERLGRAEVAIGALDAQVRLLIADKHKREGAIGLVEWIGKHWPFTLVASGLAALVAYANGLFE